jgi:trehalose 6-phosphate synthase/phosphatase
MIPARDAAAPSARGRLLIVSNRLPVSIRETEGGFESASSSGGVAVGLHGFYRSFGATWIGWPGLAIEAESRRRKLATALARDQLVPVFLTAREISRFYDGFCNGVIWPLFHYMLDRVPLDSQDWDGYRDANMAFADAIAAHYRPGDLVWVHDYHLMLLPGLLRQRLPDARIGFSLHIPFPAYEVFRILPWRRPLLEGLLGSDVIGLHTQSYVRHMLTALRQEYDLEARTDSTLPFGGRDVRIGSFPMAADVDRFCALASQPEVQAEAARIRADASGRAILLGVDRLDYTKGIPRRLVAFQRLLDRNPDLRDRVRLIQVAVPSRETTPSYEGFRRQVEALVGKIGGSVTTLASTPVHYLHRALEPEQLAALYLAADVMVVTPLRDGMNLVAKEFIACREDENGVLILSELAGAAEELNEAVIVNPFDVEGLSTEMQRALDMGVDERRRRMRALRHRVLGHDVGRWAETMVNAIGAATPVTLTRGSIVPSLSVRKILDRLASVPQLVLLLDYDGTLVPFQEQPELAVPSQRLLGLLRDLASHPGHTVHLVSGRTRETLDRWFGDVPIALWAEHGLWRRPNTGAPWELITQAPRDWMPGVRDLLNRAVASTPGSVLEEKTASIAWHYRLVSPPLAQARRSELRQALLAQLAAQPVEILEGHLVLEVRPSSINKGSIVKAAMSDAPSDAVLLAIGDDRTDEDMFAALPEGSVAVRVGDGDTRAQYRLLGPAAVLTLLELLTDRP